MSNPAEGSGAAYARLDRVLAESGATCDAAEAHGTLSSLVCLHGVRAGRYWIDGMLGPAAADDARGARAALLELATETAAVLEDPASVFAPLLPPDSDPITDRTEAIAHWAQGFLHGFGVAGRWPGLAARLAEEPLAELVGDLSEITRATVGEEEGTEDDEEAYAELVEYLRMAAEFFYLELAPLRGDRHEALAGPD